MKKPLFLIFLLCTVCSYAQQSIDLSGQWEFQLDRNNSATSSSKYDDHIILPGSMQTNGKGDPVSVKTQWVSSLYDSSYYFNPYMKKYQCVGNMKFPFFLTPEKHYVGTAWYRRTVTIPEAWSRQRVLLTLERPHIETTVFINNKEAGHQIGLSAPHVYDITDFLLPGKENTIAIKIYNGIDNVCVGQDSHSVTDQTQGDWNGIAGRITLDVHPQGYIQHVAVFPDIKTNSITVSVRSTSKSILFKIDGVEQKAAQINDSTYTIHLSGAPRLWDEFHPNLYRLTVYPTPGHSDDKTHHPTFPLPGTGAETETVFGMREITTSGRHILLNGKEIFVRGTVENCNFPETGYPPTDVSSWISIIQKCKDYGLNAMRFHSYCPPEAAFIAADSLGFYLQAEGPSWPNHGVKLRRGQYIDTYLMDETKRMVEAYGNHPSFVMMAAGNEPAGDWVRWCNDWCDYWKKTDARRLYCGASVGGGWAWDDHSQYHVKGGARGLTWAKHAPQSEDNFNEQILFPKNYKAENAQPNNTPIISHEQGQWCAFPDLKERSQYTGVYKAKNFDIFEDLLHDNGMASQAEKFLHSSGKLQTLCYKYEIERNLRTKDYTGFVLLGLNDYSGQGTALVGPLNVHWKEKGYVDSTEWTEFCNTVVPLARFPKFVYSSSETLTVPVEVYNATGEMLHVTSARYTLTVGQDALESAECRMDGKDGTDGMDRMDGDLAVKTIPAGKNNEVGTISFPLSKIDRPCKLTLTVSIDKWHNSWDFWVYPPVDDKELSKLEKDVYISDTLDAKSLRILEKGGNVLLTAAGKVRYGSDIKQTYLPVFWNTSWFKMRPPHTTGAYIDTTSKIYADFPTDDWTNINWWELVNNAQVMNLGEFPRDYQSPMQPIDTWHISRKCGMIIEARVLNGKLLMTTMDITNRLDKRLVAKQMRKSILEYMHSSDFRPSITIQPDLVSHLYENQAPAVNMFTNESPDELKPVIK